MVACKIVYAVVANCFNTGMIFSFIWLKHFWLNEIKILSIHIRFS